MCLPDDPHLLLKAVLAPWARASAQRIGHHGLIRCRGIHLVPTWTPRCAHVDHLPCYPPGRLCGQDRLSITHNFPSCSISLEIPLASNSRRGDADIPCATITRCCMPNGNVRIRRRSAVADGKARSAWVDRELADCSFKDERPGKRFRSLLEQLSSSPGVGIPLVCQDWANTKAVYRFFDNDRVSEAEILGGHFRATRERVAATSGSILVMHDTTEFSYQREDVEAVGKTRISVAGAYRNGTPRLYTAYRCWRPSKNDPPRINFA